MRKTTAVASAALALLAPPALADSGDPSPSDRAEVARAIRDGTGAVRDVLQAAATRPGLARALLERATLKSETGTLSESGSVLSLSKREMPKASAAACHAAVYSKVTAGVAGVNIAWRKAVVTGWCWDSSRLTSWNWGVEKWTAGIYCWKDESQLSWWLINPTRRAFRTSGSVTTSSPWGCAGLGQQTLSPSVHYERGGGWNAYA